MGGAQLMHVYVASYIAYTTHAFDYTTLHMYKIHKICVHDATDYYECGTDLPPKM